LKDFENMKTILVLAIRAIGDMVLVTPAIRALSEAFPGSSLTVVAEAFAADVFEGNPRISETVAIDRWSLRALPWYRKLATDIRWLRAMRAGGYDIAVDLFCGPRSAQMALFSGAPVRVAESIRGRRMFYTRTVKVDHAGKHLVEQKMQIVGALIGDVPIPPPEIFLRDEERREAEETLRAATGNEGEAVVGLFPGAGWVHKQWPAERFAQLADRLAARGCRVAVVGGPRDGDACRRVEEAAKSRPAILSGIARLRETIALIDRMSVFVSNDTGPMHIAAGLGIPTVGLFGPGDATKYRPWGEHARVVSARLPCNPCPQETDTCHLHGRERAACMKGISVDEVYATVEELLDRKPSGVETGR
jgi:lipopolysaccharide heptosyltransferase II